MKFYKSPFRKARVEIIPMIDTIFFLLVYFMFLTLQMVKMSGMDVAIPKPSPPSNAAPPPKCFVAVDKAGNYSVNGQPVNGDDASIAAAVQQAINKNANTLVVVKADPSQNVQPLITCLDGVSEASKPDGSPVNTLINGQGGTTISG